MNIYQNNYTPHPWLINEHLMTITSGILPRGKSPSPLTFEQLLIPVDSQSTVLADCHFGSVGLPCLIIVHGLEGSSSSPYVLGLTAQAIARGFNVVRLNLRNCGNTLHLTPTLYHAGQSEDLLKVIDWLKEMKGQNEQYLVGYSLGGNLILKAVAELNKPYSPVKGACAISPSIDLAASVVCLNKGINKIYQHNFLLSLKNKIRLKGKLFPNRYDCRKLEQINNIYSFDDSYTAPDAGFRDAAHYYQESSAIFSVNKIKTPTLIIAAQDDPLVPFQSFSTINNANIKIYAPQSGGHVGFLSSRKTDLSSNQDLFWADNQILTFCQQQSQIKEEILNV